MLPNHLGHVLEATGYLHDSMPAHGVCLEEEARRSRRQRTFSPDASWRGLDSLTVYFKYVESAPPASDVSSWRREIWNEAFAPLLWIVTPDRIDLYDAYGRPLKDASEDAEQNLLRTFRTIADELRELDRYAGRLAMETGQFWLHADGLSRKTSVDSQLLDDIAALEQDLTRLGQPRPSAQALIARAIFSQYLVDRRIVDSATLRQQCGAEALPEALRSPRKAEALFGWLTRIFNGDMFPATAGTADLHASYLQRVADFLEAVDPDTGQTSLFPYAFDIIPVELISAIYEQFAHASSARGDQGSAAAGDGEPVDAKKTGIHYTPLPLVSLVLDEVMSSASGDETVLDVTCGSGVFLVEALRRLVYRKANGQPPSRELIRSVLQRQIFGVDINEAAVRVTAFSLYLAALELDPDPSPPEALKFEPLIDRTLLVANALTVALPVREFDLIVGNPPWSYPGRATTATLQRRRSYGIRMPPRGEALDFLLRAMEFGGEKTKYGMVISAMPFFAHSGGGADAAREIVRRLLPVTLVNLSDHRNWLFPTAKAPAIVLLARCRPQKRGWITLVNVPWSEAAERTHTFAVSPGDIRAVPLAEWAGDSTFLKSAILGRKRDLLLLKELRLRCGTLGAWLKSIGTKWSDGLQRGNTNDARFLHGLPLLRAGELRAFVVPRGLARFEKARAHRPRSRENYVSPLLLVSEGIPDTGRPQAAVASRDLIYTEAYFGASLKGRRAAARLLAAIVNSAFAAWFYLLTSAEYGVFKRRLYLKDLGLLPVPDPIAAAASDSGRRLLELEEGMRVDGEGASWQTLDDAVFDLYGFDSQDRIVARDGLSRAGWQWESGRDYSDQPASMSDLASYAETFELATDAWLRPLNERRLRTELLELPALAPLRIVRFEMDPRADSPRGIQTVAAQPTMGGVLSEIGERLGVRLGEALVGSRELFVYGRDEVVIIKPAARRFWMPGAALEDADRVVVDSVSSSR